MRSHVPGGADTLISQAGAFLIAVAIIAIGIALIWFLWPK